LPKIIEGYAAGLEVPSGDRDIHVWDDALPGFGIRKFASGKAFYVVKFSVGHQQRKMSLGPVVRGVLAEKRKLASSILSRARIGQDVVAEKLAEAAKRTTRLGEAVAHYLAERKPKLRPRYYAEIERQLQRDWKPLHGYVISAVSRQAVVDVIDGIAARQGEIAADRARVALSGFYSWAIERGDCEANPIVSIGPRAESNARDRVLSEGELVEVWRASKDDDYGCIVRLLILTGQRRREIGDLSWSEVRTEDRQIEIPGERVKNHRAHIVPLSDQALALLSCVEQREGRDHVFGRGDGGFSGAKSRRTEKSDAKVGAARSAAIFCNPHQRAKIRAAARSGSISESHQRSSRGCGWGVQQGSLSR